MSRIEHVLINKKKAFTFEAGQRFVVKVAKSIVASIQINQTKSNPDALYAIVSSNYGKSYKDTTNVLQHFYGMAIYQVVETEVEERPVMVVFDIETLYPNHREALVGKQFITGKVGEVYVARRKVPKEPSESKRDLDVWTKPSEEIEFLITCDIDKILRVKRKDGRQFTFGTRLKQFKDISFFDDFYIFRLLSNEPPVKEPVFGVSKTVFDQTAERYIVWSPGSRQPSQQIFTSARQARYVAYRMTEENKGQVFYWAKLEGYSQWGELPE